MLRHLNDAVLRRYVDEPDALLSYEKQHLVQCLRCRQAFDESRRNARSAAQVLNDAEEPVDTAAVRAAILRRAQRPGDDVSAQTRMSRSRVDAWRSFTGVAAALVIALLFSYAPFRAYAQSLLTIFEPRDVTPISVTHADLEQLHTVPELNELGTVRESGNGSAQRFTSLAAAARFAQQIVSHPSYLPATVPHTTDFRVEPRHVVRFTFDERKARASAAHKHLTLPAPPPGLDGATLTAEVGPFVVQSYGMQLETLHGKRPMHDRGFPRDAVLVAEGPVPAARSTSLSADTIESYLLSLPNVPQDVKTQIRAIRDPASTLPIPVAIDKTTAQPLTVHGARGLLIGDNTGVGSVILWVSRGKFYWVAGGYSADEMTKVANSMTP